MPLILWAILMSCYHNIEGRMKCGVIVYGDSLLAWDNDFNRPQPV